MEKRSAKVISCDPESLSEAPGQFSRVSATTKAMSSFGLINANVAVMLP